MSTVSVFPPIANVWLYLCVIAVFEALAVYLFQFRKIPGAIPLAMNMACKAVLVLSRIMAGISTSLPAKMFWGYVSQCMLVMHIALWFEFILEVSGQKEEISKNLRFGIRGIAACLVLLIVFDRVLGWYWEPAFLDGRVLKLVFGPAAWATMGYGYLLAIVSWGFCARWILRVKGLRRKQAVMLSIAPVFTLFGNMLGRVPVLQEYTPQVIGLLPGAVYITWVFYRWRVYSILPLALDTVTRTMVDGLLVIDEKGYIVEMNPTAVAMFKDTRVVVGGTFQEVIVVWPVMAECYGEPGVRRQEIVREVDQGDRHYLATMTPLVTEGNHWLGNILVLKNITRQKQDQEKMIEQQKTLSVLSERERLGRELHDTQGQFPGYVKTQTQAIKLLMRKEKTAEAAAQLEQLIAAADAAFIDARESISSLRIAARNGEFLTKLTEWMKQYQTISGITAVYTGPEQLPPCCMTPETEVHLLRIIQETFTNARKHAEADRLDLSIAVEDNMMTVAITDNGQGFDTETMKQGQAKFGLNIIRERTAEINGTYELRSTPNQGTEVTVTIPLPNGGALS